MYTKYLSPKDYGVLELIEIVGVILSSLLGAKLSEAFFYFYAREGEQFSKHQVLGTAYWGAFVLGIGAAIAAWNAATLASTVIFGNSGYQHYLRLAFANFALSFPLEIATGYLRAENRAIAFVVIQILKLLITIFLNVTLMIGFGLTIDAILWSSLASTGILIVITRFLMPSRSFTAVSWSLFTKQLRYGFPLGISALGMFIIHSGDRFFLQRVGSLDDVGVYSLAYRIGMLVSYAQLAFITYWNAQIFTLAKTEDGDRTYVRTFTYYSLVLAAGGVVISAFSKPAIYGVTTEGFHRAAALVPWITFAYVVRGGGDYFRSVFLLHNKTARNVSVTSAGVVITLLAYGTLIPLFGIWGAVAATLVTFVVMSVVSYFVAQRVQAYQFEWLRILRVMVAASTAIAISTASATESLWLQSGIAVLSVLVFALMLVGLKFFTPGELEFLKSSPQAVLQMMRLKSVQS